MACEKMVRPNVGVTTALARHRFPKARSSSPYVAEEPTPAVFAKTGPFNVGVIGSWKTCSPTTSDLRPWVQVITSAVWVRMAQSSVGVPKTNLLGAATMLAASVDAIQLPAGGTREQARRKDLLAGSPPMALKHVAALRPTGGSRPWKVRASWMSPGAASMCVHCVKTACPCVGDSTSRRTGDIGTARCHRLRTRFLKQSAPAPTPPAVYVPMDPPSAGVRATTPPSRSAPNTNLWSTRNSCPLARVGATVAAFAPTVRRSAGAMEVSTPAVGETMAGSGRRKGSNLPPSARAHSTPAGSGKTVRQPAGGSTPTEVHTRRMRKGSPRSAPGRAIPAA